MALSQLGAFIQHARENPLTGADNIRNDAAMRSYALSRLLAAKPADSVVPNGSSIIDLVKLSNSGNAGEFRPGDPASVDGAIDRPKFKYHWRFLRNNTPINMYQMDLASGSDQKAVLKSLRKQILGDLKQTHVDTLETRVWGPTVATMETDEEQTDARPFSIPSIITQQTAPVGLASTGTLGRVNFTTYPLWDNQRYTYDSTNPQSAASGLLNAFDWMQLLTGWTPPKGKGSEAFSPDSSADIQIWSNMYGINLFKAMCRAGNENFMRGGNDPAYAGVKWLDTPIQHAAGLDRALLKQSSGTAYATAVYDAAKPPFFWVNPTHLWPAFHPKHYMNEIVKEGGATYPDTDAVFLESMWQIVCNSRRRQGGIFAAESWITNSNPATS